MDTRQVMDELARINRDIEQYEKRISYFEKFGTLPDEANAAYVFDFTFPGVTTTAAGAPVVTTNPQNQQKSVVIKKNTIFRVKSFTQSLMVVGQRSTVAQAATITLSRVQMLNLFSYRFRFHDTGADREWQNDWVPGTLLMTGNYNGLRLRKGHALCSPGAEVSVEVDPAQYSNQAIYTGLDTITSERLQIVMAGFEVPFKGGA